jgi:hypothetical protein
MFKRGISEEFASELLDMWQWKKISEDKDLFFAIRHEYINVYYQGCSIFKIYYEKNQPRIATHYKYLIHPRMKAPYISWNGETNSIKARSDEVFIDNFDIDLLKTASSYYAGAEKKGVHSILKSNKNIIDVEIALSRNAEEEQDSEDQTKVSKRVADRIDFVALQYAGEKARIVCFEAKRFDNAELRAAKATNPHVFDQIKKYEKVLTEDRETIEASYFQVCKNLHRLAADRCDPLVAKVAKKQVELTLAPEVRLVVFGYDTDQRDGDVWKEHKKKLSDHFGENLISKGNPAGLTAGISKYNQDGTA